MGHGQSLVRSFMTAVVNVRHGRLPRPLGALALCVAAACSSGEKGPEPPDLDVVRLALTTNERILSFEQVSSTPSQSDWKIANSQAGVLSSSTQHTHEAKSLGVANIGYTQLESITLQAFGPITSQGGVDILIPGSGNVEWGGLQVFVDIPAFAISNRPLEYRDLGGRPRGSFQHISFAIDSDTVSKLATPTNLVVRLTLNVPQTAQPVLVDHLSFGQTSGTSSSGAGGVGGTQGSGGTSGGGGTAGSQGGTRAPIRLKRRNS